MKLLVSVRNAEEAEAAVAAGTDWIDLKEPHAGPLGAVSSAVAREVVDAVARRCPISAALGELHDWQTASDLLSVDGIEVVKLGLSNSGHMTDWQSRWNAVFEGCSYQGKKLAAVIYADWHAAGAPQPREIVKCASRAGAEYLLIDTFHKKGLSSVEALGHDELPHVLGLARQRGLATVLAGNLRLNDLFVAANWPVDIVAIRGAVCSGDRHSALDPAKLREFCNQFELIGGASEGMT